MFQGRFGSTAMDEVHLMAAFRYIALNPVKAGLAARAGDWRWSSTPAHIAGKDTAHVTVAPALTRVGDFAAFVATETDDAPQWDAVLKAELIGRPVGAPAWIKQLEDRFGRTFAPRKRGRKPKVEASAP